MPCFICICWNSPEQEEGPVTKEKVSFAFPNEGKEATSRICFESSFASFRRCLDRTTRTNEVHFWDQVHTYWILKSDTRKTATKWCVQNIYTACLCFIYLSGGLFALRCQSIFLLRHWQLRNVLCNHWHLYKLPSPLHEHQKPPFPERDHNDPSSLDYRLSFGLL